MLNNSDGKFNLEERTTKFSTNVLDLCKSNKILILNQNIIKQLLRSATSIGANYFEANGANSKKDFVHKISICKKEARETRYWLSLLLNTNFEKEKYIKILAQECKELTLIFSKIILTINKK